MQDRINSYGTVYGDKVGMGNSRNTQLHANFEQPNHKDVGDGYSFLYHPFRNLFPLPSQNIKMATFKITWAFLHILGAGAFACTFVLSILPTKWLDEIQLADIREPYKTFIIILGIIWATVTIWKNYEGGRKLKIENDEKEHTLKVKKANDHHTHTNRRHQ